MNEVLLRLTLLHVVVVVTTWKLIGWSGALCFTARWLVQAVHRHRTASATLPVSFWWISLVGAGMTLCYFIFGKNDSVGIINTLFPMTIALYNLAIEWRQRRLRPS